MRSLSPAPLPVTRSLTRLGQAISLARRCRHLKQDDLAERIGASAHTVRRMEAGHPGTALVHFARALRDPRSFPELACRAHGARPARRCHRQSRGTHKRCPPDRPAALPLLSWQASMLHLATLAAKRARNSVFSTLP